MKDNKQDGMNKKPKTFCHCSFVFIMFLLFAINTSSLFSLQYWGEGVFADFGFSSKESVPTGVPLEGTLGVREGNPKAGFFAAVCADKFGVDSSIGVKVQPIIESVFTLSLGYLTHVSRSFVTDTNPDLFVWNNMFIVSTVFTGKNKENPFKIKFSLGLNLKQTNQRLGNGTLRLDEAFPVSEILLTKRFLDRHEVFFRLASFDLLYFRGFLNTWWQLGYSCDVASKFVVGTLLEVMYADQATLSGTMSGFQGKVFVAYKF